MRMKVKTPIYMEWKEMSKKPGIMLNLNRPKNKFLIPVTY